MEKIQNLTFKKYSLRGDDYLVLTAIFNLKTIIYFIEQTINLKLIN